MVQQKPLLDDSENEGEIPDENDNSYLMHDGSMISPAKMNIDELEELFKQLHGPEYFEKEEEIVAQMYGHITNPKD